MPKRQLVRSPWTEADLYCAYGHEWRATTNLRPVQHATKTLDDGSIVLLQTWNLDEPNLNHEHSKVR